MRRKKKHNSKEGKKEYLQLPILIWPLGDSLGRGIHLPKPYCAEHKTPQPHRTGHTPNKIAPAPTGHGSQHKSPNPGRKSHALPCHCPGSAHRNPPRPPRRLPPFPSLPPALSPPQVRRGAPPPWRRPPAPPLSSRGVPGRTGSWGWAGTRRRIGPTASPRWSPTPSRPSSPAAATPSPSAKTAASSHGGGTSAARSGTRRRPRRRAPRGPSTPSPASRSSRRRLAGGIASRWTTRGAPTLGVGESASLLHPLPISAGSDAMCVDGAGGNEYGQCGEEPERKEDGTRALRRDIPIPQRCAPKLKVRQVAAGGTHSVVLTQEGHVWTWGQPWPPGDIKQISTPVRVQGLEKVRVIAVGAFHNLALTEDGVLWAWGNNEYGQLGTGDTQPRSQPIRVEGLADLSLVDIAAGGWHSTALTEEGEVYAWGRGEHGRLGFGDDKSSHMVPLKVQLLAGEDIVQVSCGGTHSVALTRDGRMFSYGRGDHGRLGFGRKVTTGHPMEVPIDLPPPKNSNNSDGQWQAKYVACGGRHTLAIAEWTEANE